MTNKRPGEAMIFKLEDGRKIVIFIERIQGKQVRLAIEAPKSIAIRHLAIPDEPCYEPVDNVTKKGTA